jgi:hypothetical protein
VDRRNATEPLIREDLTGRLGALFGAIPDFPDLLKLPDVGGWAVSGAMALCGDADGPPLAPAAPAPAVLSIAPGGGALLGERAATAGLSRRGRISAGGGTRLFEAADGWIAVALPRPEDRAALPAWLGEGAAGWEDVAERTRLRSAEDLEKTASLLEIPCSRRLPPAPRDDPWRVRAGPPGPPLDRPPLVADLSALWAGPLCADLLAGAGATVIKVEAPQRPDGARRGMIGLFDILNGRKQNVAVDFPSPELEAIIRAANVVITSARARAFDRLGLLPDRVLAESPTVWVAVTAHGWDSIRVGFGDDIAVGAGLVADHPLDGEPRFAADAVADPLCGALAAAAATAALRAGGSWFIDASLAGAARYTVSWAEDGPAVAAIPDGEGGWLIDATPVAPPRARPAVGPGRPVGADTEAVLARL